MNGADLWSLGGVFLGGATPWLEAVIVIPAGIVAGLPAAPVVIAGVTGNLLTVGLAAVFGERMRDWWRARRAARRPDDSASTDHEAKQRRRARIERIMARWGMPALAVLGPIGLGTQVSAVVAVGAGATAARAFIWIGAGTVGWSLAAAVATVGGISALG